MIGKLALAGALAVGAVLTAAPAQADEFSFLDHVGSHGMFIDDSQVLLIQGYAACRAMEGAATGDVVIANMQRLIGYNYDEAFAIVESAVYELCPWVDRSGDAQRQAGFGNRLV